MLNSFDIAIIGGGPAGSACALALHGSGLKVVLADKEVFPRDKTCGDAIPGQSFKVMDAINPEWGQQMRQFADKMIARTTKTFPPNRRHFSINWISYSYNSRRLKFDNFLMNLVRNETGTTILENRNLRKVTVEKEFVDCSFSDGTSLRTSIVIACDGANSVVKRQLSNTDRQNNHPCTAVRIYARGINEMQEGVNEIHLFKKVPGYFWIFPLDNGWANVGFGALKNMNKKNKEPINLREILHNIMTTFPGISDRFKNANTEGAIKGFALPLFNRKIAVSGERFMLCGDAASLIDPLTGHGIDKAMWSGYLAARQAIKCFQLSDFKAGFMKQYDVMLYKKVGAELAKNKLIVQTFIKYPSITNALMRLGKYQQLTQKAVRVLKI